jgi:hypothetical protein
LISRSPAALTRTWEIVSNYLFSPRMNGSETSFLSPFRKRRVNLLRDEAARVAMNYSSDRKGAERVAQAFIDSAGEPSVFGKRVVSQTLTMDSICASVQFGDF